MREPPGTVVVTPEPFDGAFPTAHDPHDPTADPEDPRPSRRARRGPPWIGWVGIGLLVFLGLLAAGLLALQIPAVGRGALRALLEAAKPFPNATLALGDVRGSWI